MRLGNLLIAAALALCAAGAQAVNVVGNIVLVGDPLTQMSAGLSTPSGNAVTHTLSGSFTDTFTFDYSGEALVDMWLSTSALKSQLATQQIVFTSISLNGVALTIQPSVDSGNLRFGFAGANQILQSGPMTLIVNGYAGLLGSEGAAIAASYSGGINVTAVPEPQTVVLMGFGLGALVLLRRRKPD